LPHTIRAFIGFKLPGNIISSIRKTKEDMRSYKLPIRWTRPENIHLTLKFLGNIEEAETQKVATAICDSVKDFAPISLAAKGTGVFPGIKRPRILWVGIGGETDSLAGLKKALDENLGLTGFPKENRPFKGHFTIGRVKKKIDPKRLFDALKNNQEFESETFIAEKLFLFKSELRQSGPVYTELFGNKLKQPCTYAIRS